MGLNALCRPNRIPFSAAYSASPSAGSRARSAAIFPRFRCSATAILPSTPPASSPGGDALGDPASGCRPKSLYRSASFLEPIRDALEPERRRPEPTAALNQPTKATTSRFQGGFTGTYESLPNLSGIGADPSQLTHNLCRTAGSIATRSVRIAMRLNALCSSGSLAPAMPHMENLRELIRW
jgi:hypothetical protein